MTSPSNGSSVYQIGGKEVSVPYAMAIRIVLVSPNFLYRAEIDGSTPDAKGRDLANSIDGKTTVSAGTIDAASIAKGP